jgi:hypothetical protein
VVGNSVWRSDTKEPDAARSPHSALCPRQSVGRKHLLNHPFEPALGDADVVLPFQACCSPDSCFRGVTGWSQGMGEAPPLTHCLRIFQGIMLKGAAFRDMQADVLVLGIFAFVTMGVAVARFRQTLN